MKWVTKALVPAALVAAMAATTVGLAQPTDGDKKDGPRDKKGAGDRKGGDKKDGPGDKKGGFMGGPGRGPEKLDAAAEAWVQVLAEKMNDPHDVVRESARAALMDIGPAAIPTLEKVAGGGDAAKAANARRFIGHIHMYHMQNAMEHHPGLSGHMDGFPGGHRHGQDGPPPPRPEGGGKDKD